MDPNFTPGSDEHEQQLLSGTTRLSLFSPDLIPKTEFSEALVKDHEGDAQLILELLHAHHTGNSQYSRAEINRITKYLTNIKLDDTWRGTNESFLMHYNDQLHLLDSLVDSGENRPLSLQLNLFLTYDVTRSQIMSFKHSFDQQNPSHTGPILTF